MIVGSCDAVGPLACLIAGSIVLTAIVFVAVAIVAALDRAHKQNSVSSDSRRQMLSSSSSITESYSGER